MAARPEQAKQVFEFGSFRVDTAERRLLREGLPVPLTPKAFEVLLLLVESSGRVVEKEDLMNRVWPDSFVEEGNLKVTISMLRKALEDGAGEHRYIETVPRRGYRFVASVKGLSDDGARLMLLERTRTDLIVEEEEELNGQDQDRLLIPDRATTSVGHFVNRVILQKRWVITGLVLLSIAIAAIEYAIGGILFWRYVNKQSITVGSPPIPFQQITIKRLPVNGDPSGGAVLSPDGKLFAYAVMSNEGRETLWLEHVDGGEPIQLRPPSESVYRGLTFAPDGSSLYFTLSEYNSADGALYRLPVLGGVAEKVKENVRSRIAFSPDGKQFAFIRHDGASRRYILVVADTKGTSERELASRADNLAFSRHSASWSPDGSMIAVGAISNDIEQESEIFLVSLADGSIKPLTASAWKVIRMTEWLNDSSGLIAVALDKSSSWGSCLWHVSYPDGKAQRIVTDLNAYGYNVNLSADNKSLFGVQSQSQSNIWIAPADDLSKAKQITFDLLGRGNGWDGLDWTPDGRIIFTALVDQKQTLWTADADGSNIKQLLPSGYMDVHLTVTRDGRYVVFESDRSGSLEIWRANIDGSDLKQLTTGGNNSQPHVSPDGRWIVYKSGRDDSGALWRVSIDGGEPARLTEKAASWPRVSPDGKLIACAYDDGKAKLAIFSVEGGPPVKLFDVARLANFNNGLRWTPDGKAVIYRDAVNGAWKQSLSGGEPRRLEGLPQGKLYTFGWSRNGKLFAFTRGAELRDLVLIHDLR